MKIVSFRFSEKSCLKATKCMMSEKDTQHLAFTSVWTLMDTHTHTIHKHATHHSHTYVNSNNNNQQLSKSLDEIRSRHEWLGCHSCSKKWDRGEWGERVRDKHMGGAATWLPNSRILGDTHSQTMSLLPFQTWTIVGHLLAYRPHAYCHKAQDPLILRCSGFQTTVLEAQLECVAGTDIEISVTQG